MITATSEGSGNFQPIESGTYPARCYSMIHIGTIEEEFNGEKKRQNKVRISWELPTELKEFKEGDGEKPYVMSKEFTLSLHEKSTLRAFLKSWRGKDFTDDEAKAFDITKLLGVPCMISIGHTEKNGKTYANVNSVSPLLKGYAMPSQINPNFELNYDDFTLDAFNKLPEFLREKMKRSEEFSKIANALEAIDAERVNVNSPVDNQNDDLPF